MPALEKYGLDYDSDFTLSQSFRGRKRWAKEVENFENEIKKSEGKYFVDTTESGRGVISIAINEIAEGSLKNSMNGADYPIRMNIEVSENYPMEPPLVWIQSPVLSSSGGFGIFNGVPCIHELKNSGWSPIWNLTSVFQFVLNALVDHARVDNTKRCKEIQRKDAKSGNSHIARAHSNWNN